MIARKWPNQASKLGTFLDPLADKCLVATVYLTLTANHLIPVPLTSLVVARDLTLITAAAIIRYNSIPKPVNFNRVTIILTI